ncbi:hypothetical protein [Heyndrickxia camelliae]|uniref:Uncharacterized protein n=1 Tax=Heyndrickxia camelliae TaxID=1707093 RepID=A0A2N3LFX9_9BACI|nr:hypothetical protein [Heyndrickxia camelliae]PKR83509.1 hypothetical protein CWO92_18240 [Heyndrickxia camelliae]
MKVYLVDVDNGESYEDHRHWIEKVFTSYRGASQYLINEGYEVYYHYDYSNEIDVDFYWQENDAYMANCSYASIIEKDLEE